MRCTAHSSRTGQPCRRHAILGGTVCPMHGGSAPQVKRKAEERLMRYALDAVDRLIDTVRYSDDVVSAVRAAKDILDRVGIKNIEEIRVTTAPQRLCPEDLTPHEVETLIALYRKLGIPTDDLETGEAGV